MLVAGGVVELLNAIPRHIVESFEVQDAALYLASREAIYRSGRDFRELDGDQLKAVMARGEPVVEVDRQLCYVPVRMGVRPVGSLGISGAVLARETLEALGTLIAIAVERVSAIEALGKAEAARQEERLRSALLDSVTHELRTPLTAIKASVTSLLTQPELSDAQRRELFSIINEESDHLNHLIEEALEMARLDAGEIELEIEPHPIREVIEAAIEASKNILANHTVDVRLPESLPPVPMDPARIREVLTQLLDNAVKYSPPGTPIVISSEVSGRFLVTSVADRGAGIDSFEQALIFDKFYRGRDQRYRVQGTGMGLAICKAIVEAHGGSMGVTSQVGSGSVFHFNLPLSAERGRGLMSSGRVLILDDEAQIRRVLRTTLVASGFVVREARSGEEALEMIREEMPDLLIIDINLPGMSGFEVCREIREFCDVPIIMLSVRNNERDKVRALDSGRRRLCGQTFRHPGTPGPDSRQFAPPRPRRR